MNKNYFQFHAMSTSAQIGNVAWFERVFMENILGTYGLRVRGANWGYK